MAVLLIAQGWGWHGQWGGAVVANRSGALSRRGPSDDSWGGAGAVNEVGEPSRVFGWFVRLVSRDLRLPGVRGNLESPRGCGP